MYLSTDGCWVATKIATVGNADLESALLCWKSHKGAKAFSTRSNTAALKIAI